MSKKPDDHFQIPEYHKNKPEKEENGIFIKMKADRIRNYSAKVALISAGMSILTSCANFGPPNDTQPTPTIGREATPGMTITPMPTSAYAPWPTSAYAPWPTSAVVTVTPTPTRRPTYTPTPTRRVTPTPTRRPTYTPTPTPTVTPTPDPASGTVTPTPVSGTVSGFGGSLNAPVFEKAANIFKIQIKEDKAQS